jgi:hypothetical protein
MQPSSVFFDFMLHPVAAMGGLQEVRPSAIVEVLLRPEKIRLPRAFRGFG